MKFIASLVVLVTIGACTTVSAVPVPAVESAVDLRNDHELELPDGERIVKRDIDPGDCLDHIYVMGFTGGHSSANAPETAHEIVIRANGETQHSILPDLPNDDFQQHKGDLWKLHLQNDFHFVQTCIKLEDIEYIALKERHNDAWQIDSVVTFFRSGENYQLATVDIDIFLWLEGNSDAPGPSHRRIELTRVI